MKWESMRPVNRWNKLFRVLILSGRKSMNQLPPGDGFLREPPIFQASRPVATVRHSRQADVRGGDVEVRMRGAGSCRHTAKLTVMSSTCRTHEGRSQARCTKGVS